VFAAWHEALLAGGVRDYSFDEALSDFRLAVLHCLSVPVKALYQVGPEPSGRTARLVDAIAERVFASALEIGAGALLPSA